jgi:hypothetical protein
MRTIKSISIKKFIEISDLIKDETTIHERMNVIQIVTGCDMDDIRIIPAEILDTMWNEFVHNCFDLGDGSVDNIITIDGKSYGLTNVKKLTVGEMADIDVLKNHPILNFNLHKIMAILYRPLISKLPFKVDEYTSEGFEERAELFAEKMPVKVALNTAVFFLNILGNLSGVTKDSLETTNQNPTTKKKTTKDKILKLLGVGIRLFIFLRKTTSLKSTKSQK